MDTRVLQPGGSGRVQRTEGWPSCCRSHLGVLDRVGLVRATPAGREKRYRVDDAQLARAVAQLSSVGSAWDARLRRIRRIAEAIQRSQQDKQPDAQQDTQQD